jgi:hypothetical protein
MEARSTAEGIKQLRAAMLAKTDDASEGGMDGTDFKLWEEPTSDMFEKLLDESSEEEGDEASGNGMSLWTESTGMGCTFGMLAASSGRAGTFPDKSNFPFFGDEASGSRMSSTGMACRIGMLAASSGRAGTFPDRFIPFSRSSPTPSSRLSTVALGTRTKSDTDRSALRRTCSADQRALVREWLVLTGKNLDSEFAKLDVNGDGFVTRDEMKRAVAPLEAKWHPLPDALLAMGDADSDGKISLSEFRSLGEMLQGNLALQRLTGSDTHAGITCDVCKASPIRGTRHKCTVCWDYDLCDHCYSLQSVSGHTQAHSFKHMPKHNEIKGLGSLPGGR